MLLVFLFNFLECQNVVHYILINNNRIFYEKVKFWAAKATKIIKILDLFKNADISKIFAEFRCFDKKITESMFLPLKTPIKTKYKCQKTEKVDLDSTILCK